MDKRKGRKIVRKLQSQREEIRRPVAHNLSLDELFDVFIAAKRSEGRTNRTIEDHRKHYRYFREWLQKAYPNIKPDEIDANVIREWISYMLDERRAYEGHPTTKVGDVGLSPSTVNIRLRSIKCMFRFLYEEGYLTTNPTERIKLLRTEDEGIFTFTPAQVKALLAQCDLESYAGFRDYTLMATLLDTGLRISEALSLTHSDVDVSRLLISVSAQSAKTRRARQVPISKRTARLLNRLIAEVRKNFPNQPAVFVSNYGERLLPNSFRQRLLNYAKAAGIRGVRVSPHTFRHTFAKMYIKNGGDPFTLQTILGHSSLEMVRRYVNMFTSDVAEQHKMCSPFESLHKQ